MSPDQPVSLLLHLYRIESPLGEANQKNNADMPQADQQRAAKDLHRTREVCYANIDSTRPDAW